MATMRDIAELCGVSTAAVSRALNNDPTLSMSEARRKNISETATKLGYILPKRNRTKPQKNIAFVYWRSHQQEQEDSYYVDIRAGIEGACHENDINLIKIYQPQKSQELVLPPKLDGAIALGYFSNEQIAKIKEHYSKLVFVDGYFNEIEHDCVVVDFPSILRKLFIYLENLNHKNIVYVGGRTMIAGKIATHDVRALIFEEYFKSKYAKIEDHIYIGEFTMESGYNVMSEILKSKKPLPDAFIMGNDVIAIGALKAINDFGYSIPKDFSITGFNDIPQCRYTTPPLTTINVNQYHMGRAAVDLILEQFSGRKIPKKVLLPTNIVIRESCSTRP